MGETNPKEPEESAERELDELARLIASWVSFSMRMNRKNEGIKAMADLGLTFPQIAALHILMFEGAMAVSTLTDKLELSVSATSHLVQRLVEADLVKRNEHDTDRRQKVVSLSDAGRALIEKMMKARLKEFRSSVEHVSADLRKELKSVLQKVVDELAWSSADMCNGGGAARQSFRDANAEGGDFAGQDLANADFTGANLEGADFSGANASGARFTGANLAGADLTGAVLTGARFTSANLEGTDLTRAAANGASFESANLEGAELTGAQLRDADFTNANLQDAEVDGVDVTGARFDGANLPVGFRFTHKIKENT